MKSASQMKSKADAFGEIKSTLPPSRRISSNASGISARQRFLPPARVDLVERTIFCLVDKRWFFHGTPDGIRTHDLQSRSLTLYPAELRARLPMYYSKSPCQCKAKFGAVTCRSTRRNFSPSHFFHTAVRALTARRKSVILP